MPQQQLTAPSTVLVVEDDPSVRFVERYLLEDAGYTVVVAINGEQALELAPTCHADLVVLDVGLPTISGLQVLHVLRGDPATSATPVLVVSAYAPLIAEEHRPYITAAITKPFEQTEFLDVVARLLRDRTAELGGRISRA